MPVADRADRVREHDRGVGDDAAPVAGVHAARPEIADEIERGTNRACPWTAWESPRRRAVRRWRSARPPSVRPHARRRIRASRCEPRSSLVSSTSFTLNPSLPPRSSSTCSSAVRLSACWPLLSALPRPYQRSPASCQRPRIEARVPLVFQAAHGVAVAVGEHGAQRRVLDALGGQDRAETWLRIVMHRRPKTHALDPRPDALVQIPRDVGLVARVLRGASGSRPAPPADREICPRRKTPAPARSRRPECPCPSPLASGAQRC